MAEREWWQAQGYLYGRELGDGLWVCVAPMLLTFRLMLCTPAPAGGVLDFYCYESPLAALGAAATWDGTGDPGGGWVKSRTRAHGERWAR